MVLQEKEIARSRALWEKVFCEDSVSFLDYYYDRKTAENEVDAVVCLGAGEKEGSQENRVISMIHWNPYKVSVSGQSFRVPFIVGVATEPEHRHRGHMKSLLTEGLRREARRGTPFVWLIPADSAIYTPFGFRYAGARYCTVLPGADGVAEMVLRRGETTQSEKTEIVALDGQGDVTKIVASAVQKDDVKIVASAVQKDDVKTVASAVQKDDTKTVVSIVQTEDMRTVTSAVQAEDMKSTVSIVKVDDDLVDAVSSFLNARLSELFDLFTVRDAAYILDARAQYESDDGGIAAILRHDRVNGFFTWWPEDGGITVRELVLSETLEEEGFGQLEQPLREWFGLQVADHEPHEEGISTRCDNYFTGKMTVYTTGWTGDEVVETPVINVMLRVADVRGFLEMFRASCTCRLRVKVTDELIPENNQVYDWMVSPEGASAAPIDISGNSDEDFTTESKPWDIEISTDELASWLLEGRKGASFWRVGACDSILPLKKIHLPECV